MSRVRLKHVARLVSGGTPSVDNETFWADGDSGNPWVTISDMSAQRVVRATARQLSDAGVAAARLTLAPAGTVLYSIYASVGLVARLGAPSVWNQAILGVIPRSGVSRGYLAYALEALRPSLGLHLRSNTQHNLNAAVVGNFELVVPSETEQVRIVEILDAETARIDASVEQRSRQVALLGERRRAVMFAAVTGRLGTQRDRRSSDVPWFSTLPERWSEVKLTRVAQLGSGHTPSRSRPEWWVDCAIPWITTGEVAQIRDDRREVILHTRESISQMGLANSAAELRPPGTLVLCRTAASAG